MNVEEIYELISKNTDGGKLKLSSSTLGGAAQSALDAFFDGGALQVAGVSVTKESDRVVARGLGSGRPFDQLDLTAAFMGAGSGIAADMTATLEDGWRFSRSFPALSGTFLDRAVVSNGMLLLQTPRQQTPATITGALTAELTRDGGRVPLGRGFFRAQADGRSYLAGFATPGTFSPGSIWGALQPLFTILQFSDSGLIYSTIEAKKGDFGQLERTSVPETIKPGVTFFTTLKLGGALQVLAVLLGSSRSLNLRGRIDLDDPVKSVIDAQIPGSIDLNALRFEDLALVLRPGASAFDIAAKAVLTIGGSSVKLDGGGTIEVAARRARLQILIPKWDNALGIPQLSIADFGLGIGVETSGVAADFLGHFEIGGAKKVRFQLGGKVLNFAEPVALTFTLDKPDPARPLKLSDIIEAFTSLDLGSVPLIKDIAFRDLAFYAIADPSGRWTAPPTKVGEAPITFNNGIGLRADLRIFDWDMQGQIDVGEKSGIKASGKIVQAIDLLGILRISSYDDRDKGPSFKIDTSKLKPKLAAGPEPRLLAADDAYFAFDGAIDLLGLSQRFKGSARDNGFNVDFTSSLAGLFTTEFHAAYEKGKSFAGSASGGFDLRLDLPALKIAGVTIIPSTKINGPTASLALNVAVSTTNATVGVRLKFAWLGADFDIGFELDGRKIANLLSNLWNEIKNWIVSNLEEFYKVILASAEKFVNAIKDGALWVADQAVEIANALKKYFNCAADEVSKFLKDVGCAVEDVVKAVADAFTVAYDEAARIVTAAIDTCGVGMTRGLIGQ